MSPRSPQIPLNPVQPGQEAAEPIAVVGLACRFPGAADADAYWRLLRDGREGLTRFTDGELIDRGVPAGLRGHPHFVPVGGLIEGQADFDPAPFGFTDAEAALLDPQHRLFLECAWHALEHAGHGGGRDAGSVGVFAGAAQSAYLASNLTGRWDPTGGGADPLGSFQTAMATQADYLPLQTAYRLDLTGPAVAVASTCSTSLVAVHLAAQSLLAGECDTALAGGVSLIVPQGRGYLHVPDGMFSADGAVRPFSERGTGIVYTQGAGVVALRRLSDALADRDPILALLHGSAVNNDGADKAGFTAPSVGGQVKVLAEALAVAGLTPREIGLIEAHGTATRLGDPIEVTALRRAFGQSGPAWCGLGSVKGNIGHANTAAGIASFIKAVLAVHHRVLPASLHARPLNPHLGLADSPFEVITETRGWDTPPYAGVSSFGIGGTNCHAVLGPAPDLPQSSADARPQLLVVSAATPQAASAGAAAVAGAETPGQAADLAYTLAAGRAGLPYRIAAVGSERLARAVPVQALVPAPRVVLAFPGAGSPYPGMGGGLYRDEPVFTAAFDECADLLRPLLGADVRDVLDPGLAPERVRDAAFGLPALFAVSFALSRLLTSWGVQPQALVGHSLGECTAAAVSGALPLPEAARLVAARCTAAARAAGGGAMLAVPLDEEAVLELLRRHPDVDLAAVNAPGACVVSGPAAAVRAFAAGLRGGGVPLHVDAAMHSRLMEGELPALRSALAGMTGGVPRLAVFSTVTGGPIGAELADPEHWVRQLRSPVRYSDALRAALGEDPALLVEAGPGTTLSTLARKHTFPGLRATVTALAAGEPESVTVRQALGVLWSHGVPVDPAVPAGAGRRRVAAPGYAFQRRRLWIEPQEPAALSADTGVGADQPLQLPVWRQVPPLEPGHVPAGRWLVAGRGELPDAIRTALAAGDREEAPLAGLVIVAAEPDGTDRSPDADLVGAVVDGLLEFGAHAAALAGSTAPAVLLVTRRGERVGGDPAPDPRQAALRTLPRVLGQEHPGLRWATVDLGAPGAPAAEASSVLRELTALTAGDGAGAESVLRGGTRWQRRLVSWRPTENGLGAGSEPVTGTVLITGGLGAVGRLFAEHLAERGHRVVVTSRTGARTGAALTQAGVQVRRCDATDPGATTELLRELSQDGPVELVVHAAGVVAGAELDPVRALDPERTAGQVRAKLGGALALRTAIEALAEDRRPRTVVLMSSVTTLVGGIGMGAYAAANAAMDAFAASAVSGTPDTWCSAVWDGWRVGEEAVVLAEALDAATGTRALDRLLEAGARGVLPPAVAVAATDLNPRITASGQPRKPVTGEGAEPASAVEEAVAGLWSDLFGAEVGASDADFFALGGHSLLAVRMLGALRDRYGVQLGLRDLLDAPTVAALAKLVEARSGSAAAHTGPDAPTPYRPAAGPDGDGTFAMTRVQHAYWVGRGGGYQWGEVPCHFYLEYDCPGLDLARYEDAWNNVLARHPMLRAVTTPEGRFRVLDDLPRYRIRAHDLTEAPEERRTAKLAALRERLSTQPGPPDRWPLVQIQAARLPDEKVRLFIGVDVLVCDAASWWIVEAELRALYQDPHAQLPPIDVHPAECAHAMDSRTDGTAAQYWRARLPVLPGPPALPTDGQPQGRPRFVRRSARLSRTEWAGLRELAAEHRVTPTAVLLTVYADALTRWSGSAGFSLTLTLFDRPPIHPHVNRVVGDFTSLVLHEVPAAPAAGFAERVAATQARLFEELDHRGFSALDVLAEQGARTGEVRSVPVVFTSALGMDGLLEEPGALEWAGEQVYALSQTPQTWLDHQVLEHDGELRLQWDALEGVLPADELETAIADHVAQVRELATDPRAWTGEHVQPAVQDVLLPLRTDPAPAARPTLFLAHPSGGDVLCYVELSKLIDPRVDVVAVADPELSGDGSAGPETISAIAGRYVQAIRTTGRGPWLLGGWSMGGSVAQEMARQLHQDGEQVSLLVMLDSNDPALIRAVPGRHADEVELAVALRHVHALEAFLGIDLDAGDALAALPRDQRLAAIEDRLRAHRLLGRGEGLRARLRVFARHLRALAAHTPAQGTDPAMRTLLVRADKPSPRNSGIGMGVDDTPPGQADLGWGRYLAGPVQVVGVGAHHYSLLHPPVLQQIAQLINNELDRVLP
ncbi:SDR family NAD(P)-dependent oxidoreductase [Planomonospora sp. ID91781]|uniref:type I polyketide synthase n=1 Tax=Planomonospora sp. ID91781 TaxID=2738135 RepID=UPI0018C3D2F5|nr:type I polyketide synthase [Planomonospora sp. ID91781]MBG0823688.1 SDR family NAD(P)-dependent oxidoreductase [Planomonospora sp. ID91781]